MAVTLPTQATWGDDLSNLTQMPGIGLKYINSAPLWQLFGQPVQVGRGQLKFKWGGDATAASAAATAGTPYTTVAGSVATVNTVDFAAIVGSAVKAYDCTVNTVDGGSAADQSSMDMALAAIYDQWVTQLVGSGDGTDHAIWGAGAAVTSADTAIGSTTMHVSGSYTQAAYAADNSVIFDAIDAATVEMSYGTGADGYFVCISDKTMFNKIKQQLRKTGGVSPADIAMENFGPNFLMYDGIIYTHHRSLVQTHVNRSHAFLFKIGAGGVSNYAPAGADIFTIDGPVSAQGYLDKEVRIILNTQVGYNSPRCVAQLTQIIGTQTS